MPPTSALAARIAVSNSTDAVRAGSVTVDTSRAGFAQAHEEGHPPITAALRAADELRRAQQATIEAAQNDERRRSLVAQNLHTAQGQMAGVRLALRYAEGKADV